MPARAINAESKKSAVNSTAKRKKTKEEKKPSGVHGGQQQHLVEHSLNGKVVFPSTQYYMQFDVRESGEQQMCETLHFTA